MAKGFAASSFGKSKAPPFGGKGAGKPNPFAKKGAAAPAAMAPPPEDSFAMKKGGRVKKNKGGKAC